MCEAPMEQVGIDFVSKRPVIMSRHSNQTL